MLVHREKDDLETLANRLLSNPDFQDPLLYVSDICSSNVLASSVVNHVLNKLLLEDYVSINIPNISVFLQNLLISFEFEGPHKYHYKEAVLKPSDDFPDLWSILTHLINSSFSYHGINLEQKSSPQRLVQHPLCDLLLHFYVDYILKFLSLKRDLFEDSYEERRIMLMKWINICYESQKEQVEIVKDLQSLLEHAINSEIMCDVPSVALNQANLSRYVSEILKFCKDCFTSSNKFLTFTNCFKSEHISACLCYHLLNSLTGRKIILSEETPITLKEIVHCFFFVGSSEIEEKYLVKTSKEKVMKNNLEMLTVGDKKFHTLCRMNLFADLHQILSKLESLNLNIRNLAQQTPLHVASLSSSYLCAKILLDSVVSRANRVDLAALDVLSCTPLHYAIIANDIGIAKMLIEHGGKELLFNKDCYGLRPFDYVNSIEMRHALQNLHPSFKFNCVDFDAEKFEVSTMKCADYSTYLSALHSLLCYYFNIYHLHEKRGFDLVEHSETSCGHFVSCSANKICIVDYSFVHLIPKMISDLDEHANINAKKSELDKQVFQLRHFSLLCDILINSLCP